MKADMMTCYTLLNKPVEKPKKWKYGETAPYEGADCCPAYACRKLAGVPMGKTGARSKKKQKADGTAAAAAMGAAAPLELIEAKQVLGQRLIDEMLLARVGADRGEKVSESLFVGIEWLLHGEWRAAGKPDDAAFYGARWFGQAALREVLGDGAFEKMVRDYAQLMIDLALKPEEEDEEGEGEERDEDVEEGDEGAGVAGAAHDEDGEAGDVEVRCCRGRHCPCPCPCPCPDRHSHLDACRRR